MSETKEQVLAFLGKCEELKKCKFIMATTKIKDLLKSIVNSPDLYRLFDEVTKDFNYPEAKAECFITVNDGGVRKNCVVLPQKTADRLALIFCLFVDFDRDTVNFNDFLRKYFHEDGSYYASYRAFCSTFIDCLEEIIRQAFSRELGEPDAVPDTQTPANSLRANLISEISLAIADETRYVAESRIPEEEKEGGSKMLEQLMIAVKIGDENLIDALICGYNYYALFHRCVSEGFGVLIQLIAEYEKTL